MTLLSVRNLRVVFGGGERILDCVYANRRSIVYDLFKQLLKDSLLS